MKYDIASNGFTVHHVSRLFAPGGPQRGGGLALIHRDDIKVKLLNLGFSPFEVQSLVIFSATTPILIVNVYHPHASPPAICFDELSTLLSNTVVGVLTALQRFQLCWYQWKYKL